MINLSLFKVRGSACCSLRPLAILSVNFAGEALNLLMDVLNDDSLEVRLKALETMHHMAIFGCLRVQEAHMHMVKFRGCLHFHVYAFYLCMPIVSHT